MLKQVMALLTVCLLASGCVSKTLKITAPSVKAPEAVTATVKIESVKDDRVFIRSPQNPAKPSIEDDKIDDKKLTDKAIGRMRHGLFHTALWNYSLKDKEDIYSLCERIASNSLVAAGYRVVDKSSPDYATAIPVSVNVNQFWIWMQPKFNIDLNFDGELALKSENKALNVSATGSKTVSTAMATPGVWESTVDSGVASLQANLIEELLKRKKQ